MPLLYTLIQLYAGVDRLRVIPDLDTFRTIQDTPFTQRGEHRIKWLTKLVLYYVTKHYTTNPLLYTRLSIGLHFTNF